MNLEKIASILKGINRKNIPKTDWSQFGKGSVFGEGWNPIARLRKTMYVANGGELGEMLSKIEDRRKLIRKQPLYTRVNPNDREALGAVEEAARNDKGIRGMFNNKVYRKNPDYDPNAGMFQFNKKDQYHLKDRYTPEKHERVQEAMTAKYLGGSHEEARETLRNLKQRQTRAKIGLGVVGGTTILGGAGLYKRHLEKERENMYNDFYRSMQ